ncbi:MAG: hypothetical protein ACYTGG_02190 [Planctomycetota bacterium]|jgi:hypothetical protein
MRRTDIRRFRSRAIAFAALLAIALLAPAPAAPRPGPGWRTDPAWYAGKAEWALYDAERSIYGRPRSYEATIFTNKQQMDPATTTKSSGLRTPGAIEVFKHNVSEMIPTENYAYRFLTTSFVRTGDLATYKIVMSSQEDCGTTYKQFVVDRGRVEANAFCYFPDAGAAAESYRAPDGLAFHDGLTLTLRDYPFEDPSHPAMSIPLVPDQTDTHLTPMTASSATVTYAGRETVEVPYGEVDAHHLRVAHDSIGGVEHTDYWFAAAPSLRHVLVQYEGPWGVKYRLKRLDWWAYWSDPRPE